MGVVKPTVCNSTLSLLLHCVNSTANVGASLCQNNCSGQQAEQVKQVSPCVREETVSLIKWVMLRKDVVEGVSVGLKVSEEEKKNSHKLSNFKCFF